MEKFKTALKKEILLYVVLLLVLTIMMHSDIVNDPFERFQMMQDKENYSHPFLYTFIVYVVFFIIRKTVDFVVGLFEKKS